MKGEEGRREGGRGTKAGAEGGREEEDGRSKGAGREEGGRREEEGWRKGG